MANNKLLTNLITGTAIIASLGTSTYAGVKVFANNNAQVEVPEVSTPTPTPSNIPEVTLNPTIAPNAPSEEVIEETPVDEIVEEFVEVSPTPEATLAPSSTPASSDFPVASATPAGRFDDDDDEDEEELEHEDRSRSRDEDEDEDEDKEEDDGNEDQQDR